MIKAEITTKKLNGTFYPYNIVLAIAVCSIYAMAIFPEEETFFNIFIVGLFIFLFFLRSFRVGIKMADLAVFGISMLIIIVTNDISRIALFFFYCVMQCSNELNKDSARVCLLTSVVCMSIIVIAYFLGFNTQYDTEIWRPTLQRYLFRRSFGFSHPNQFMINLFTIFVLTCLISNKLRYPIIVFIISTVFFIYTSSRTSYYCMIFIMFCLIVLKIIGNKRSGGLDKLLTKIYPHMFLIFTIISLVLSLYFYDSFINSLLTGRLALNNKYLSQGVFLFGNLSLEDSTFDNSYIHMLVTKGYLYFIVYLIIFYKSFKNVKFDLKLGVLFISIMLLVFMEVVLLRYNVIILFALLISYSRSSSNDTKNNPLLLVREM